MGSDPWSAKSLHQMLVLSIFASMLMNFPCRWQSDVKKSQPHQNWKNHNSLGLTDKFLMNMSWNLMMVMYFFVEVWHYYDTRLWRVLQQNTSLLNSHVSSSALKASIGSKRLLYMKQCQHTEARLISQVNVQQPLLVLVYQLLEHLVGLVVTTVVTSYSTVQWTVNISPELLYRILKSLNQGLTVRVQSGKW